MNEESPILKNLDDDGVLLITLNRPRKKNAFSDPQWDGLRDALNEAREDPAVAVVVLTGAGTDFSAGQDLTAFGGGAEPRPDGKPSGFFGCVEALFAFDKPLLGAGKGVAVGGGCTLLIACDVTYLGESIRMRLPFASLGLVPEIASSYTLQSAIGRQRAAELFFTAEWITAQRALEMGMAARVLPDDQLLDATLEKAREMAQWPVSSLQAIKQTLMVANRDRIQAALAVEDDLMMKQAGSPENIEAITAFIEKRDPDFKKFRQ
ncbi:MAG: enoyl-CoA hydratase-related protein [Candidatus Binatia bacterium]|nr:enoyl-CoA hydratase-related protein [Candidatus Binatia bacterium]